jgi:protein-S-isoprenylcysteine O-methyltransferase Ste14
MNPWQYLIGRCTIHPVMFIIGKLSLFSSAFFCVVKWYDSRLMQLNSTELSAAGIVLIIFGTLLLFAAMTHLGESLAVGLPEKETKLKTHGLYRFSRNPIYLSAFLMCAGSCLYAVHWINFLFFSTAVVIHHAIIKKEEAYLENKFGAAWLEYKQRVSRYIGLLNK